MKWTVYLSDELGERVEAYLREHKEETFSGFVQRALEEKFVSEVPSTAEWDAFMSLADIADGGERIDSQRSEDEITKVSHDSRDV